MSRKKSKQQRIEMQRTNEVVFINPAEIRPSRNTGRYNPEPAQEAVDAVAASIREQGQLQPVMVRRVEGGYAPIYGFTRIAACRQLDRPVWAEVVECDDVTAQEMAFSENLKRTDLTPIDIAYNCDELRKAGLSGKAIAEKFGYTPGRVSQLFLYLQLPEAVREAMARGLLGDGAALALCRIRDESGKKLDADVITTIFAESKTTSAVVSVDTNDPEQGAIIEERYDTRKILKAVEAYLSGGEEVEAEPESDEAEPEGAAEPKVNAKETMQGLHRVLTRFTPDNTVAKYIALAVLNFINGDTGSLELQDELADAAGQSVDTCFPEAAPAEEKPKRKGRKAKPVEA